MPPRESVGSGGLRGSQAGSERTRESFGFEMKAMPEGKQRRSSSQRSQEESIGSGGSIDRTLSTRESGMHRRRAAELRFSSLKYQPMQVVAALQSIREKERREAGLWPRLLAYCGVTKGGKAMGEAVLYAEMRLNSNFTLFLNMAALACCCVATELETNYWYLENNGDIKKKWEPWIVLLKTAALLCSLVTIIVNIRYHVLKLTLAMNRMDVPQHKRVSIWQVPHTAQALLVESLLLLVSPAPYYNGEIMIWAGLSRHDPPAKYRYDVFVFIAMLCLRWKFIYRRIYIHQDLFSVDAIALSRITGTPITARLGIRHFIAKQPATVLIVFSIGYLFTIAYIHNKLEGVSNYWFEDRFCVEVDDLDECTDIYHSEHPVTYLNSMWIHFVSASTIGYGEYQVNTQFGRSLVCMSFIVGLMISSFVVTVLFEALSINSSEQYIVDKLRMKRMNKKFVDRTAILIQQLMRGFLLRRERKMLLSEHPDNHRCFTSSKILTPASKMKRIRDESTPARRHRVEKAIRTHEQNLNVAMYQWRAVRRDYKNIESLTVDKDATMIDLDRRCEFIAGMLFDCRSDMNQVQSVVQQIRSSLERGLNPAEANRFSYAQQYGDEAGDQYQASGGPEEAYHETPAGEQDFAQGEYFTENPMHSLPEEAAPATKLQSL